MIRLSRIQKPPRGQVRQEKRRYRLEIPPRQRCFTVESDLDAELTHQPFTSNRPPHHEAGSVYDNIRLNIPPPREQNAQVVHLSPVIDSTLMARQEIVSNSTSRVSLDHFDRKSVRELSRSLSQSSQAKAKNVCDSTLTPDEPFSLEKTLRAALDKYTCFINPSNSR